MFEYPHQAWDLSAVLFCNQFCGVSQFWDTLLLIGLSVEGLRSAILMSLVMGIWEYGKVTKNILASKRVIAIILSAVIVLVIVELMNDVIISPRPSAAYIELIHTPILGPSTEVLYPVHKYHDAILSSFPSDTIAFLFTLAIGLLLWNRTLGIAALFFVLLVGVIPRLYFAVHYPSDLIAGLLVAILSVYLVERVKFFDKISDKLISLNNRFPFIFGALGFYVIYSFADKFSLLKALPSIIKTMFA